MNKGGFKGFNPKGTRYVLRIQDFHGFPIYSYSGDGNGTINPTLRKGSGFLGQRWFSKHNII